MNEWQLQHELSKIFRRKEFLFRGHKFDLVLWELMFPSWEINDNRKKWNEPSVDFIFYSEKCNEFLCVELKNILRGKKNLLSAYYQTTHRTILFIEQYSKDKVAKARKRCFNQSINERGGIRKNPHKINFSDAPSFKRILMAYSFSDNAKKQIDVWNSLNLDGMKQASKDYSTNREIDRFIGLTEKQFCLLEQPLSLIQLTKSIFKS